MTTTLIFWIKAGIIGLLLFTIWNIARTVKKQKKKNPSSPGEWKKLLPELLFLGLGVFFFFWVEKNFQRQLDIVIHQKDKSLQGLYFTNLATGQPDSLAAYKDKVVILNIWATWCGPCRRELPDLEKLYAIHKDKLVVLALSDETEAVIRDFNMQRPSGLIIGAYYRHPLLDSLSGRPVSILLDRNNRIKDVVVGARGYNFFSKWISAYL
jgi:thiol-disulfide isomerase/thioredoxin